MLAAGWRLPCKPPILLLPSQLSRTAHRIRVPVGQRSASTLRTRTQSTKRFAPGGPILLFIWRPSPPWAKRAEFAEATWRTNSVGALNLACAIARTVPESMVFNVSTGEVYGSSFLNGPASETTPLSPRSVYARSKAAAETIFEDVLPRESRLVTVRPLNHTGAGQDERFVLPSFAAQIARIEAGLLPPKLQVGNLGVERDFLDVRDVIDAYLLILAGAEALPRRAVLNVASGQARRIGDLLDVMVGASTRPFEVEIDPARLRPAEIPRAVGDASALRRHFGWTPKHSVDELVVGLLTYWRARISAEPIATLPTPP